MTPGIDGCPMSLTGPGFRLDTARQLRVRIPAMIDSTVPSDVRGGAAEPMALQAVRVPAPEQARSQ